MSTIIRLRNGTLEFRKTHVRINGEPMSMTDFLLQLLDAYYRLGIEHEHGSAGWLEEWTGEPPRCPFCDRQEPMTGCPTCSINRCPRCAVTHDNSALCLQTREYADIHRQMRDDDDFDPSDWYFARRAMAPTYIRRSRH